jgi:hypothetical protein
MFLFTGAAMLIGPFSEATLDRNPAAKNAGKFVTLAGFLDYAKASNISGILIGIEVASILLSTSSYHLLAPCHSVDLN